MWNRKELKTRAKAVLKISYWKAFLISLIIAIAGGNNGGSSLNYHFDQRSYLVDLKDKYSSFTNSNGYIFPHLIAFILGIGFIIILLVIVVRIFLGYVLEVGGRRYFIHGAQNNIDMNNLAYGFKNGRYKNIVGTMLWRGVLNFLWYLLLIIPGIIKFYAYRMVPYILADNPNIGYKRAIELSEKMTAGQKMDMFILDLSFIGWYLLGAIAFGVGEFFVMPYSNATNAELYLVLRQHSIDSGFCSYEELLENDILT